MMWHVPNDVKLSEMNDRAFFKYKTTNGFLGKYGYNLQTLFSKHVPIRMAGS